MCLARAWGSSSSATLRSRAAKSMGCSPGPPYRCGPGPATAACCAWRGIFLRPGLPACSALRQCRARAGRSRSAFAKWSGACATGGRHRQKLALLCNQRLAARHVLVDCRDQRQDVGRQVLGAIGSRSSGLRSCTSCARRAKGRSAKASVPAEPNTISARINPSRSAARRTNRWVKSWRDCVLSPPAPKPWRSLCGKSCGRRGALVGHQPQRFAKIAGVVKRGTPGAKGSGGRGKSALPSSTRASEDATRKYTEPLAVSSKIRACCKAVRPTARPTRLICLHQWP